MPGIRLRVPFGTKFAGDLAWMAWMVLDDMGWSGLGTRLSRAAAEHSDIGLGVWHDSLLGDGMGLEGLEHVPCRLLQATWTRKTLIFRQKMHCSDDIKIDSIKPMHSFETIPHILLCRQSTLYFQPSPICVV